MNNTEDETPVTMIWNSFWLFLESVKSIDIEWRFSNLVLLGLEKGIKLIILRILFLYLDWFNFWIQDRGKGVSSLFRAHGGSYGSSYFGFVNRNTTFSITFYWNFRVTIFHFNTLFSSLVWSSLTFEEVILFLGRKNILHFILNLIWLLFQELLYLSTVRPKYFFLKLSTTTKGILLLVLNLEIID